VVKKPLVAIVGRMNVGKSTLFNRISSEVKSLTLDYAGVTRDVIRDTVSWQGHTFDLVDTGGIRLRKEVDEIQEKVREKALSVVENADVVLLVIDGAVGVVPEERDLAQYLHKLGKKTIIAVNKIDRKESHEHIHEAHSLGFKKVVGISASHATGISDLLEAIIEELPQKKVVKEEKAAYRVMLLGRPNVGKSSLMNALLKHERSIVSSIAGTTREPITESVQFYKEHLALTDTPGIRRKRAVKGELEEMMIKSAFASLKDADIILMLIDANEGMLADQDLKLAFYAFSEQYRALIIVINKIDSATSENIETLERSMDYYKHLIDKVPVLRISCKTGKNIGRVLPTIQEVWERANTKWTEAELMNIFMNALRERPLVHAKQLLRLYRAHQLKAAPITIVLEVNEPVWFESSQLAFFENLLRDDKDLRGVSVRFVLRKHRS
jgi:GTPase